MKAWEEKYKIVQAGTYRYYNLGRGTGVELLVNVVGGGGGTTLKQGAAGEWRCAQEKAARTECGTVITFAAEVERGKCCYCYGSCVEEEEEKGARELSDKEIDTLVREKLAMGKEVDVTHNKDHWKQFALSLCREIVPE